jgi:hypothetical protein
VEGMTARPQVGMCIIFFLLSEKMFKYLSYDQQYVICLTKEIGEEVVRTVRC